MKTLQWLLVGLAGAAVGACGRSPHVAVVAPPVAASASANKADQLPNPTLGASYWSSGLGTLEMKRGLPIALKCHLTEIYPDPADPRRYFVIDLNDDGRPEYVVEDSSGAHSVCLAVVDSNGKLLVRPSDVRDFGGDRLLVLASKHHGYHDLVCSYADLQMESENKWEFNGSRYVQGRTHAHSMKGKQAFAFENTRGSVIGSWYCDLFSVPPGYIDRMMAERRKAVADNVSNPMALEAHGNGNGAAPR